MRRKRQIIPLSQCKIMLCRYFSSDCVMAIGYEESKTFSYKCLFRLKIKKDVAKRNFDILSRKHFRHIANDGAKRMASERMPLTTRKNEVLRIVDIRIQNFTTHQHLFKQPPSRSEKALKRKLRDYTVNMSLFLLTKQQITSSLSVIDTMWMF